MAFCDDKLSKPEFFCWPGAWMVGHRVTDELAKMFDRQSAPFLDKPGDGGIYPRLMPGKDEGAVQASFNSFYAGNLTYDLTRQWIAMNGPFANNHAWLSSALKLNEMKDFADRNFEQAYGARPDSFEILGGG